MSLPAVVSLAFVLLPLVKGAVENLVAMIRAIAAHPSTPEEAAAQLTDIATQLDQVVVQVARVQVRRLPPVT